MVDPDTRRAAGAGTEGELVLNLLTKGRCPSSATTGDVNALDFEPCRCGRTTGADGADQGPTDDMLVIKGGERVPLSLEAAAVDLPTWHPH